MSNLALFQEKEIRRHWDAKQEKRYFSVVDIVIDGLSTRAWN
jgi:hypothetical protein